MRIYLAFVSVLAACGGHGSSDDWVPSDIDEQQTVDRLGDAGYQRLCRAFDGYVRDQYKSSYLVQATCTAHALRTTTDAVTCGESVDACVNDLPDEVETELNMILAQAGCSALGVMPTLCSSPVSAVTSCLDAYGEEIDTIKFSLTCAAFGSPVPADWWHISPPPECASLISEC